MKRSLALALLVAAAGCSREEAPEPAAPAPEPVAPAAPQPGPGPAVERRVVTVTNVVTVTRTVLVTNVVNVAGPSLPAERPAGLSSRRTAPYVVTCDLLADEALRKELSSCGARVISTTAGTRAVVEASERSAERLRAKGMFGVRAMAAADKVGAGAEGDVLIHPLSVIDEKPVSDAVRALGGDPLPDRVEGRFVVRAKLSGADVMKLAARGDVRRIERDMR